MNPMYTSFNGYLGGPIGSIIGAILIFVIGWLVALGIAALVRGVLSKVNLNQRMNSSTGKTYDLEGIISKVVFWFIFIIAISGTLTQLNLDSISAPFANMVNQVLAFTLNLIGAIALGMVGWFVATIARTAINAALAKTSMDEHLSAKAGIKPMSSTIADMVYWFILLVVLTMVLGQLNLDGLFAPLTNMVDKIFSFIPNILIAGVVFFIGYIIAKVVRGIVTNLVSTFNVQELASKAGLSEQNSLPNVAGSLAFLVVIIPTIIAALDALKIEVIARPATNMLNKIIETLPNILMAVAILVVTFYVVRMVANIIKGLIENTQINQLPAKVGLQEAMGDKKVSDLVSYAMIFFAMLFASIAAADLLGFEPISAIITMFITFGANIILGAIILFIGFWLANIIAGVVERSEQGSQFLANIVRVLIMGLVLAMGLKAMGIADSIVNLAFGLTLGAVAVAFALSFGLGGQEAAARFLRKMQDKMDHERTEAKAKSALQPSSSTQEKVADSVRENTPSAASTPTADLRTDVVDTPRVDTNDIYNSDEIILDNDLNDDINK
ncbi:MULTISPECIES: mechanosensitive ion channel [unclassified Psychrobacter]|uniref:mechanosensitive ion channel n=1 Tax=unclassified Psychrobacter TaxID=196806 RepID=UPI0025B4D742|nr:MULTISPECIES: mechanosensitive ion channel [unclassified Psychrobacter]MDN3453166.1 mechanosensitive ion channel [Psychrobacter sp. APC 3350]MDN3503108.1 mechanosensitive ion channel [Psychrobacter sp. 5A.1]